MISIIMGVYNEYLKVSNAIYSILNQSFKDFEFIICDDCSTDDTFEKLTDWQAKDSRIVLLRNDTNMGLAYTLNKCLSAAKYEYIARMDADDYSHSNRLAVQYDFLVANPQYSFVGSDANLFDENGIWGKRCYATQPTSRDLLRYNQFIHPSMLFTRSCLTAINGYKVSKHTVRCEDYDLFFRLYAQNYIGYNIPETLINFYEDKFFSHKHNRKTRYNEFKVRKNGAKLLKASFREKLYCYKPLLLMMLPKKIYTKLHQNRDKLPNDKQ